MIRFDPFASYLAEPAWVVVENGPRAFAHKLHEGSRSGALVQADVVRCGRNVMWHMPECWPIFCVLDRPKPVSGPCDVEPGFYFVTPGGPTPGPVA